MKKILNKICIVLVIITVLSSLLAGCSENNSKINTKQNADTYVENEDYQNFLNTSAAIAKVKNGYYFFNELRLYYFDSETKEAYPVCNKPNCNHNGDCTAFFPIFNYYPFMLSYYNNSLYVWGWEEDGNTRHNYIYEISLDNYKRKKAVFLFDSTSTSSIYFIIHRGYVYYIKSNGNDLKEQTDYIYRAEIGDTNTKRKEEKIYKLSGIGASIWGLTASNNNLIVLNSSYEDTEGNGYHTSYTLIDIHSLESKEIAGNEAYSLFADGEFAYYGKGENKIYRIDLNTNKEDFFCDITGPCYVSADSNYIYFDNLQKMYIDESFNDRKILVYDKNGNFVTEIIPKNPKDICYFGGDDVMIFCDVAASDTNGDNTNNGIGYYVLDKSQLTSHDKQFIDMK